MTILNNNQFHLWLFWTHENNCDIFEKIVENFCTLLLKFYTYIEPS